MFRKPKKRIIKKTLRKTNKEEDQSNSNSSSSEEDTEIIKCKLLNKKLKTSKETSEDDKKFNIHKFESKDTVIKGKDLATRTAEYTSTAAKHHNPNAAGPLRAPTNVRATCRFDYQPDICKDYKETGFCGFGDTCIYLHDRGDYKSGWQLEAEWEEKKKKEMEEKERQMLKFMQRNSTDGGGNEQEEEAVKIVEEDGIPYACHICRKAFQNPIVTSCSHYFCQDCISKHFRIDASCPICKKDTHGVFNYPTKLYAKKKRVLGSTTSTFEDFLNAFLKKGTEADDE